MAGHQLVGVAGAVGHLRDVQHGAVRQVQQRGCCTAGGHGRLNAIQMSTTAAGFLPAAITSEHRFVPVGIELAAAGGRCPHVN